MGVIKIGTLVRFKADGPEGRTYRVSARAESEYGDSALELEGGRQSHTVLYCLESDVEEVKRPNDQLREGAMSEEKRVVNAPTWAAENPTDPLAIGYEAATRAWLACHDTYLLQLSHQGLPKRKLPQVALGAMHGYRHEIAEQILERIKAEGNIPCDIPF